MKQINSVSFICFIHLFIYLFIYLFVSNLVYLVTLQEKSAKQLLFGSLLLLLFCTVGLCGCNTHRSPQLVFLAFCLCQMKRKRPSLLRFGTAPLAVSGCWLSISGTSRPTDSPTVWPRRVCRASCCSPSPLSSTWLG